MLKLLKQNLIGTALILIFLAISDWLALSYQVQPIIWPIIAVFPAIQISYGRKALFGPLLATALHHLLAPSALLPFFGLDESLFLAMVVLAVTLIRSELVSFLVKRFINQNILNYGQSRELVLLLIFVGPVSGALASITVLVETFYQFGSLVALDYVNLMQWFVAMSAGGAIFTPLLLVVLKKNNAKSVAKRIYLVVSGVTIILFFTMLWLVKNEMDDQARVVEREINQSSSRFLKEQFTQLAQLSSSVSAAIQLNPDIDIQQFSEFIDYQVTKHEYPLAFVSWSRWVSDIDRKVFEIENQCTIKREYNQGFLPSPSTQTYAPVTLLYPSGKADDVICFDLLSEPFREESIWRSIESNEATLSMPVQLSAEQGIGVLLVTPLINDRGRPLGIISAVILIEDIFRQAFDSINNSNGMMTWSFIDKNGKEVDVIKIGNQRGILTNLEPNRHSTDLFGRTLVSHWHHSSSILQSRFGWQILLLSVVGSFLVILVQYIANRLIQTNIKIAEEVRIKTAELTEATAAAENALSIKSSFLSNMSHEIRTPLNAIIGYTELAQNENDEKVRNEYLQGIWSSSEALQSLINDVLDYAKIEAGKLQHHNECINLKSFAKRIRSIFTLQARRKGIDFNITLEKSVDFDVVGDLTRIQQIVLNLCSNAIKFTEQGAISLSISTYNDTNKGLTLNIFIQDTGIGMSDEALSHLFEEFTQADSGITRKYGGTGLGLAITKSLIDFLDGSIEVQSVPQQGTEFNLSIPVTVCTKSSVESDIQIPVGNFKLLVVDDNIINLKVTHALLVKNNFKVVTAQSGIEAIAAIEAEKPDLVFMDMQMPEMDGLEATRKLRKTYSLDELTIVGLTANSSSEDINACLQSGMNDHLSKPISIAKLSRCLSHWLR